MASIFQPPSPNQMTCMNYRCKFQIISVTELEYEKYPKSIYFPSHKKFWDINVAMLNREDISRLQYQYISDRPAVSMMESDVESM